MAELDEFLNATLPRQMKAETALHNGDPEPRLAMWTSKGPVTRFSDCTDHRFEPVAAGVSGDLAYTVGYEHVVFSIDGGPVAPLTLRVTHLYRREDGEWKTVHRHADPPPVDPALAGAVRR